MSFYNNQKNGVSWKCTTVVFITYVTTKLQSTQFGLWNRCFAAACQQGENKIRKQV